MTSRSVPLSAVIRVESKFEPQRPTLKMVLLAAMAGQGKQKQ